jgi:hypothetical protein
MCFVLAMKKYLNSFEVFFDEPHELLFGKFGRLNAFLSFGKDSLAIAVAQESKKLVFVINLCRSAQ